ncbi:serine/threonine-protein kinase [Roseimaritima ulvae]|uniref:non-specific serine/threonine protein kinase n=1 Tax=Roseimaritima ulvae TaxID=980254 RepID=A0A5B9QUL4_9BACT|nr:serine/threonine-protein kinase [Roseimaritima ulvae]QEG42718.1 Serine/threonine-protein kinase PknB [Roseimaritima ulvae]
MSSLDSIMADYLQRLEAGEQPAPETYLAAHPEHSEELRDFFQNHHWMEATEAAEPDLTGTQIGPYQLEHEIARGGMGVVYQARQQGLRRRVAVKLINGGVLASAEQRQRFRIEAEAAARMNHPHIVPIYDIGTWQGHPYFSMALVEGPTLEPMVQRHDCTPQCAASMVRDIALAIEYAHQQGIVHRDLKPDNVLLDGQQRPMLTDFGLAKWHRDGTLLTRTGQILGTPAYMSPEQAAGRTDTGPAADIYALGAILYALLTGRPPHQGDTPGEILQRVLTCDPIAPRQICPQVPADLEHICMQCLEDEPENRYASAAAVAEDLSRWLAGHRIVSDRSSILHQLTRALSRDQHQEHFRSWGRALFLMGCTILAAHTSIFVLNYLHLPQPIAFWVPRAAMFVALLGLIYYYRDGALTPHSVAERPVWSIWSGYLVTLAVMNVMLLMGGIPHTAIFPVAAALSGFGFLAMGGHVWGGAIVMGIAFQFVALLALWFPTAAPLLFGGTWFTALTILARRYRRPDAAPASAAASQTTIDQKPLPK